MSRLLHPHLGSKVMKERRKEKRYLVEAPVFSFTRSWTLYARSLHFCWNLYYSSFLLRFFITVCSSFCICYHIHLTGSFQFSKKLEEKSNAIEEEKTCLQSRSKVLFYFFLFFIHVNIKQHKPKIPQVLV